MIWIKRSYCYFELKKNNDIDLEFDKLLSVKKKKSARRLLKRSSTKNTPMGFRDMNN
jgi:hypothetical protein